MSEISTCIKLHIGAHRTATTSLQAALQTHHPALSKQGVGDWGPTAMRAQRFPGVFRSYGAGVLTKEQLRNARDVATTNAELVRQRLKNQRQKGHAQIILSEENLLGSMRINFLESALYPDSRHRLAVISKIFAPYCRRISLTIRSYETYWPSLISFRIMVGSPLPTPRKLGAFAGQPRRWQHVIEGLLTAFPAADIRVMDFERWAGHPEAQIDAIFGAPLCLPVRPLSRHNAAPGKAALYAQLKARGVPEAASRLGKAPGPYRPFSEAQIEGMQTAYAQDLAWLRQGHIARLRFLSPGDTG